MLRTRPALTLFILALIASLLPACGSGDSGDVKNTLDKAFSTPIQRARIGLNVTIKLDGVKQLNDPIKLSVQGPYESGGEATIPKADWDISASAAGQNFTAGFISTGDNAWVGFQGQNYEVGKDAVAQVNAQIKQAAGKNDKKGFSQFGVDPRNWLTDAKDEGSETVAGVETDHVSAALDVGRFLDDINNVVKKTGAGANAEITPEVKKQVEDVVKDPRFDVYVGKDDNVIRRLSADITFSVPNENQEQLGGLKSGTVSFSIEFAEVGKAQTISAPESAKPISELVGQLGGLAGVLGGAGAGSSGGGSGSGSSGSSSGSGAPNSDALQEYSTCLQKADPSNSAELEKCAEILK